MHHGWRETSAGGRLRGAAGKAADVDIHASYAGALTVDEQDDIRADVLSEQAAGRPGSG